MSRVGCWGWFDIVLFVSLIFSGGSLARGLYGRSSLGCEFLCVEYGELISSAGRCSRCLEIRLRRWRGFARTDDDEGPRTRSGKTLLLLLVDTLPLANIRPESARVRIYVCLLANCGRGGHRPFTGREDLRRRRRAFKFKGRTSLRP